MSDVTLDEKGLEAAARLIHAKTQRFGENTCWDNVRVLSDQKVLSNLGRDLYRNIAREAITAYLAATQGEDTAERRRWRDGWMPIETAPKKGIVLLYAPKGLGGKPLVRQGEWHNTVLQEPGWLLHHGPELYARWEPTHWRPLPDPPAMQGGA